MAGVEVGGSYMSAIDDAAVSTSDGNRSGELHWAIKVVEMVSAGVGSAGIGEPERVDGDIKVGAVVDGSCGSSCSCEGVVLGLHVVIQGVGVA
jgi:hypothetical protein